MPVATTARTRTRIEPGEYRATCIAIQPPAKYRQYARWYLRVDFAIHDDGAVVSKYVNLGTGDEPNARLGPRSDYYKLWSLAVGRKPDKYETMDPAKIIGTDFLVSVRDKQPEQDGDAYSVVESVQSCSSEALSLYSSMAPSLNGSITQDAHVLSGSTTQATQVQDAPTLVENPPKDHSATPEDSAQLERRNKLRRIQNKPELTLEELQNPTHQIAA